MPEPAEDAPREAADEKGAASATAKKAEPKPKRDIPTAEDLATWVAGAELPDLHLLFDQLNTKLFDAKVMQIKKEELLPQHWQVISRLEPPPDGEFDSLAEVERLRRSGVPEARIEALRTGWRELRGKRPALWNASDVFAAMRRIVDKKHAVDFHDFLSAVRDVWTGLDLPQGREQLEVLWACLDFVRSKTR